MLIDRLTAPRRDRPAMPSADPIRRFVETLEALERAPPKPAGGRVRALDPAPARIPQLRRPA
jgi:hypothetical protein